MTLTARFQKSFAFNMGVTAIEFGAGKVSQLGQILVTMQARKALIVTDKGVVQAGLLTPVKDSLQNAGIDFCVFDEVEPNPLDTTADKGGELARSQKPDVIVALGGGSPIDCAKAISILATHPGTTLDWQSRKLEHAPTPLVAIPTTSGTGSEGNWCSVITRTDNWSKIGVGGGTPSYPGEHCIAPVLALDDPMLTLSLPPFQTATTGIDAFSHHYDGYTANVANPISDAMSEYSFGLIRDFLPIAYANGSDLEARERMMLASCLGGIAFANSACTGVHCLGEALGGMYGNPPRPVIPHGLCCALFLPWMMEFNCLTDPVKHANIARLLGENVDGLPPVEAAYKCVDGIKKLIKAVELPTSLEACGVKKEDLPAIAERATWNGSVPVNPRVLTYDAFLAMLEKAYRGW